MSTIDVLGKYLQKYISITGLTGSTYAYKARSDKPFPSVMCQLHREKCKPGSWLYVALDSNVDLGNIKESDKLYVGSQTQDRMFRGDGLKGTNFHHLEMRMGNGSLNLVSFLEAGNEVTIYLLGKAQLYKITEADPELRHLQPIISTAKLPKYADSPGYWYEQIILYEEKKSWDWNSKCANGDAATIIGTVT